MNAHDEDAAIRAQDREISDSFRRIMEIVLASRESGMTSGIHFTGGVHPIPEGARIIDRLSDSIEINQAIVNSVTAIVVSDTGQIIGATAPADMLFGYAIGEMAGTRMSVHKLVPLEKRPSHERYFQEFWRDPSARQMGTREMILEGIRRDGTRFMVEVGWGTPLYVLGIRAVVASIMPSEKHNGHSPTSGDL
jgi:PAS domain S-box-containing protein